MVIEHGEVCLVRPREGFAPLLRRRTSASPAPGCRRGDPVRLDVPFFNCCFSVPPAFCNGKKIMPPAGRVIPCDFIGVVKSQQPVYLKGESVNNHDELMSNFFAQPDALAYGKSADQLESENVAKHLIPHKTFSGNRPSLSLLLPSLSAYNIGQLLAIYEHRIAVEGFIWGINSFDQWGVELGKSLASKVRKQLNLSRVTGKPVNNFNFSTTTLLNRYLQGHTGIPPVGSTILPKI